jgi:hypothetical protein
MSVLGGMDGVACCIVLPLIDMCWLAGMVSGRFVVPMGGCYG